MFVGFLLTSAGLVATQNSSLEGDVLQQVRSLDHEDAATQWSAVRQELSAETPPSSDRLDKIFDRFAASARGWTEVELLPAWGQATLENRHEEANEALRTARRVAEGLAAREQDRLLAEAVGLIDQVIEQEDDQRLASLAAGHAAYAEGLEQLRLGDAVESREAFHSARGALASAASPFVFWVDYQLAVTHYQADADTTRSAMSAILEGLENRPYGLLRGRCHWMRGLVHAKQGNYASALEEYDQAYLLLHEARDHSAAAVLGLQATVYQKLGLSKIAWDLRLKAIQGLALQGDRRQLHNYLNAIVLVLLEADQPEDATAWGAELLANAEAVGDPARLAEATLLQGRIQAALDEAERAVALFEVSRSHARELPVGSHRDQLEALIDVELGKAQVETQPQAAVIQLTEALEVHAATGHTWQRPRILRDRARAYGNLGDTQLQRKDLEAALGEVDRRRKEPGQERFRISYWETVQDLLDDMVRFQALTAHDPEQAYLYAEQSRGRALLDRLRAGWEERDAGGTDHALEEGFPEVEKIRQIQRLLPKGSLLVEAAVLDDHLIVWLLDRKNLDMRILEVEAAELTERVEQLRSQMNRRAGEETIQETAGEMFDLLFGPISGRLRKAENLIVVPDRTLHRLPWAVLFDRKEGEYLVENHALTVLPSASILTLGQDREPFGTLEEGPVLVVGDPAFNRDVLDLERLPGAAEEAMGVAGLYGRSTHLTDQQATRSQLLEALELTRVLHVAGHVQVNERDPLQSSIPLTPETADDLGLLHAREIYDLPLSNVELVVLSACRSVDGFPSGAREGVAGLARAFLAAGAGAVVASLWDVYDEPSRRLMETFHGHFREGVPAAAALRQAQISLLWSDDPRLRHPASWAGFEALGWAF